MLVGKLQNLMKWKAELMLNGELSVKYALLQIAKRNAVV